MEGQISPDDFTEMQERIELGNRMARQVVEAIYCDEIEARAASLTVMSLVDSLVGFVLYTHRDEPDIQKKLNQEFKRRADYLIGIANSIDLEE